MMGTVYNTDVRPKKTRQGRGQHTKYSATSRNKAKKDIADKESEFSVHNLPPRGFCEKSISMTKKGHGDQILIWISVKSVEAKAVF